MRPDEVWGNTARQFSFPKKTCIRRHGKTKSNLQNRSYRGRQLEHPADYPGAEPRMITGLTSKADADDWMNGERRIGWLRSQGYAK